MICKSLEIIIKILGVFLNVKISEESPYFHQFSVGLVT